MTNGEDAMTSVAKMVRECLSEGSEQWDFVLICRRRASKKEDLEYLACTYACTEPEASDLLTRALATVEGLTRGQKVVPLGPR